MIRTDYFQQQTFKYLMKDYLATPYPSRNYFMLQVVQHQLANKEQVEYLKKCFETEFNTFQYSESKYDEIIISHFSTKIESIFSFFPESIKPITYAFIVTITEGFTKMILLAMNLEHKKETAKKIYANQSFNRIVMNIKNYEPLYIFDLSLRDKLDKMAKITDNASETGKKYFADLKKAIEKELKTIAVQVPLIDPDLIKAWTLLIQNTDLKNISIPVEQIKHKDKYPKANLVEGRRQT
jgi:hypothetical protein